MKKPTQNGDQERKQDKGGWSIAWSVYLSVLHFRLTRDCQSSYADASIFPDRMKDHVPYDENLLAHQEPVVPISQWQEFNDAHGIEAVRDVLMELRWKERVKEREAGIPTSEPVQETEKHAHI